MTIISECSGKSEQNEGYNIKIDSHVETDKLLMLAVTVTSESGRIEPESLYINVDIRNQSTDLVAGFVFESYATCLAYCAGKTVVKEAIKCIRAGHNTASDLVDCLKEKGISISKSLGACFLKCTIGEIDF